MNKKNLILYAVTDRHWLNGKTMEEQVEDAIKGGVTFVQLREKTLKGRELEIEAVKVQAVCKKHNIPFVINDDVYLAEKIHADGVHLGQSDMEITAARKILGPDKIIGATAKTVSQAKAAEAAGADYLGSGAAFTTETKLDAVPIDHSVLQKICESVDIPVIAIGGVTIENVGKLKGRKLAGVAAVGGIFGNDDITKSTFDFKAKVLEII